MVSDGAGGVVAKVVMSAEGTREEGRKEDLGQQRGRERSFPQILLHYEYISMEAKGLHERTLSLGDKSKMTLSVCYYSKNRSLVIRGPCGRQLFNFKHLIF